MKHARAGKKLGRDSAHRKALYSNLAGALITHGRIQTTEAKAKADAAKLAIGVAEKKVEWCANDGEALKADFAAWVYGAEGRATKVDFVTGDVALTAPQRLAHIAWLQGEYDEYKGRMD